MKKISCARFILMVEFVKEEMYVALMETQLLSFQVHVRIQEDEDRL